VTPGAGYIPARPTGPGEEAADEEEEAAEADKVEQGDEPLEATQPPPLVGVRAWRTGVSRPVDAAMAFLLLLGREWRRTSATVSHLHQYCNSYPHGTASQGLLPPDSPG
jgi:hypothetical protein